MRHLFIGAEGTLGIVTEVQVKLERQPKNLTVMVLGVPEFANIMQILSAFQSKMDLTAFEFFDDVAVDKLLATGHVQKPFETDAPFYALLEFEAPYEPIMDMAMQIFEDCMSEGWVLDGVMSQSIHQAQELWKLREYISETISVFTPYKMTYPYSSAACQSLSRISMPLLVKTIRIFKCAGLGISAMVIYT